MKRKLVGIMLAILLFNGCGNVNDTPDKDDTSTISETKSALVYSESTEQNGGEFGHKDAVNNKKNVSRFNAQEQYDIIISSFIANEPDKIKELFCEKIKNTHNLDDEINCAMQFIDGKIVSYFVDKAVSANGGAVENGDYIDIHAAPWILDIKTDTGANYDIHFFSRLKYLNKPDEIGVQFIKIIKDNGDSYTIGEYFKGDYGA